MACFKPIQAFRNPDDMSGKLLFSSHTLGNYAYALSAYGLKIPCGQCVGCRLEYSRQWAIRCCHEASLHTFNSFITLTYSPEHLPEDGSLDVVHFQKFMKRLRKKLFPLKIRFFHCGEYGDLTRRPHYHALIFGHSFPDRTLLKSSKSGNLYTSDVLSSVWGLGHASVGDLTFESAAYVARYVMKKVNGKSKKSHYEVIDYETGEIIDLKPEYTTMSRKPGIAGDWFDKYHPDVYPSDSIHVDGREMRPPKFYDKKMKALDPALMEDIIADRLDRFDPLNNTPERLKVRYEVTKARLAGYSRDVV